MKTQEEIDELVTEAVNTLLEYAPHYLLRGSVRIHPPKWEAPKISEETLDSILIQLK